MAEQDFYTILGVSPEADGNAIHRSYWLLARKYQALAPSDPRAEGMLDDLNEAYATLGAPLLRAAYDADRAPAAGHKTARGGLLSGFNVSKIAIWRRGPGHAPEASGRARSLPVAAASVAQKRSQASHVDDLRLSTASIVGRWRKAAAPDVLRDEESPDSTLVDIFQSERDLDQPEEPLTAALDVLRGSREVAGSR